MKRKLLRLLPVAAVLLTASCVDKSYDLDDIDLTLSTNADLALPLINTSEIKLANFVLPNDNDPNGFIHRTTIPGQDGKVFYAHVSTDENNPTFIDIPVLMEGDLYNDETHSDYSLPNSPNISIPEMPDFLKGDDIHLDLKNPIIFADVEGGDNIPAGCMISADVTISTPEGKSCVIKGIASRKGKQSQYIAEETSGSIPNEILEKRYGTPLYLRPTSGSVSALFAEKIPSVLNVQINKLNVVGVGATPVVGPFRIKVSLALYAPLCIGSTNFCLSYTATATGWSEEFDEDIRKMDVESLSIKADLTNNLPLSAEVNVIPIDLAGNEIPELDVLQADVPAGNTTAIAYTLKANKPGTTLHDYINGSNGVPQFDGVKVVSKLKANAGSVGKYITDKASVRFTNLELRAKGKFTYDAN